MQLLGYFFALIVISGAILSQGSLIFLIIFTSIRRPRAYQFFRYSLTTVGFSLSTSMIFCWMLFNTLFKSSLDANQLRILWTGVACFSIPMVLGVLAAFGTRFPFVKWMGRFVNCLLTPIAVAWILLSKKFPTSNGEEISWFIIYTIAAALWWELLIVWDRKVQKQQDAQWN